MGVFASVQRQLGSGYESIAFRAPASWQVRGQSAIHFVSVPDLTLSVIATVLNERAEIDGLLQSLRTQVPPVREVVIVDGGSTDGTWERLQETAAVWPALRAIRDESCSLRRSSGPIARGRNVAIEAANGMAIACADAGCRYDADWLLRLSAPLRDGSEYALGGSRLELDHASVWDVAAAPFLGVKLSASEPTKSCTARSMAFTREAWARAGGFPETLFIGEDVLFDQAMRQTARTAFAAGAKARYTPQNGLPAALAQVASYALADGIAGMRPARLLRNVQRCLAEVLALVLLRWSVWPAVVVLLLEIYFAYRLDGRSLLREPALQTRRSELLVARLVFSLAVPWVVAWNQVAGSLRKQYRPNRQNAA